MILHCVLWLIVYAIIALVVMYIFEQFVALPANITLLIRALLGLLLLIYFLSCVGFIPSLML